MLNTGPTVDQFPGLDHHLLERRGRITNVDRPEAVNVELVGIAVEEQRLLWNDQELLDHEPVAVSCFVPISASASTELVSRSRMRSPVVYIVLFRAAVLLRVLPSLGLLLR